MIPEPMPDALVAITLDPTASPAPDLAAEPDGFLVAADDGTRIHFHDWGVTVGEDREPGVVLVPGLLGPAWTWAPVARRLARARRTVVADLRGHGLSDAPLAAYDIGTLAADVAVVAEGSGVLDHDTVVLAGHGFGAIVATGAATILGERCSGLVLVDGGWERVEETTGVDVDEFLRGLDEPPEVLRSMDAWLADRRDFDPASWDVDQERAARDAVVETAAGRLLRTVRPHVVEAVVRAMFAYEPADALARVTAPVTALVALGAGDPATTEMRLSELRRTAAARSAAGRGPIRVGGVPSTGHNLVRYRPVDVTAAILAVMAPSPGGAGSRA
jgi:pimeloyl-ACP methyl ester carboxylesterase